MNIRNVLKTYANLRQLTNDETALLNTLRALNDSERELVVQSLQPERATKKASKKPSKSKRASLLASAIKSATTFCAQTDCGLNQSSAIHDATAGYGDYHEFVPAFAEQSAAVGG